MAQLKLGTTIGGNEALHTGNFTDSSANWNTAYGWGNHASAGYISTTAANAAYQAAGNYFTDGDTVLNMTNNDGLVYDDATNKMYVKLDGTNREIYHTGNFTDSSTNWNTAYTDRNKWDGGSTGLTAATGRTSLGLGTAATAATGDFATAAQGVSATTAEGWGDHAAAGYAQGAFLPLAGGTLTGKLLSPRTSLDRANNTASGYNYYSETLNTWQTYMASAGQTGVGYNGNLTAPSGTYVTTWAMRSVVEPVAGYGWTWEELANSATTGQSVIAELSSATGNFKTVGSIYASGGNSTEWNTAYDWGNHAAAGYASGSFLPLAGGTITGNVTVSGYIKGSGQQLVLSAGEAQNYATGQTAEYIYMNAEQGIEVNSETGNWSGGWAARKTAYLRGDQLTLDGESLTKTNIQNFKTAYGWGDHGALGYATETWVGEQNYASDAAISTAIGTVTLASLGYTGATNANYITNNNQLTNGNGYLTSTNDRNYITDSRGSQRAPSYYNDRYAQWDFQNATDTLAGGDSWHGVLTVSKWANYDPSHRQEQIFFTGNDLKRRTATSETAWGAVKTIWDSGNFDPDTKETAGAAAAVNTRIDTEIIPSIPTDNSQLGNGAGYVTTDTVYTLPSAIPATSIAIGSTVTLTESADRADLLYINSGTSTWGGLQIGNTSNEFIFSLMGDGNVGGIYDDQNADWIIYWVENAGVELKHNGGTKLTTTADGVTVTGYLTVSNDTGIKFNTSGSSGTPTLNVDSSANWNFKNTVGTNVVTISNGGALVASGDVTAFSDARVKENVETIPNALESVKQMRGVIYNKIGADTQSVGVIAQELEEVVPQLVHTDEEGMKSVAYGNITAVLIEAIKEQQVQIEELKAKLDGLTK